MNVSIDVLMENVRKIEEGLDEIQPLLEAACVEDAFVRDFARRFCWSSNSIEGNTLSLEETVALIDYDEVRAGHTFTEYQEATMLFKAISQHLVPFCRQEITEAWIRDNNRIITGDIGEYRQEPRFVGNQFEIVYTPPQPEMVPGLMREYIERTNFAQTSLFDTFANVTKAHLDFERIHPFNDGNGRTGRMIMNQQLINHGLLPICIKRNSDYYKPFRQHDKTGDMSKMMHLLCKAELQAIEMVKEFGEKMKAEFSLTPCNYQPLSCAAKGLEGTICSAFERSAETGRGGRGEREPELTH